MSERICANCRFFYRMDDDEDEETGECRVNPPTLVVEHYLQPEANYKYDGPEWKYLLDAKTRFPDVKDDQWCGKWEERA